MGSNKQRRAPQHVSNHDLRFKEVRNITFVRIISLTLVQINQNQMFDRSYKCGLCGLEFKILYPEYLACQHVPYPGLGNSAHQAKRERGEKSCSPGLVNVPPHAPRFD